MNKIEKALVHALFEHPHHNIDETIDFDAFKKLNQKVSEIWPNALVVGPDDDDDAAVFNIPGIEGSFVGKMESHCSPTVPRPYDAAATGASGAMRDVVAMGGQPIFLMDFIGTKPPEEKVIVGPCGFDGKCTCGECKEMTSGERVDIILRGIRDMCAEMDVFVIGGGFSTSFSDIVPAVVVSIIGKLITEKPLTKPAKQAGHKLIIIGETGSDGNDTLYRAGLADEMRPAVALFSEEKTTMEATLAAFRAVDVHACSDLGAGGIGAAVCESARFGGWGAKVELADAPVYEDNLTPEEILICETQGRMLIHVSEEDVDTALEAIESKNGKAALIGEITDDDKEIFTYNGKNIATIPNNPDR